MKISASQQCASNHQTTCCIVHVKLILIHALVCLIVCSHHHTIFTQVCMLMLVKQVATVMICSLSLLWCLVLSGPGHCNFKQQTSRAWWICLWCSSCCSAGDDDNIFLLSSYNNAACGGSGAQRPKPAHSQVKCNGCLQSQGVVVED